MVAPKALNALGDATALLLAMVAAYRVGDVGSLESSITTSDYALLALVAVPLWLLVFARYGLYASRRITGRIQEFRAVFHAVALGTGLMTIGAYVFELDVARRWVLLTFVFALAFVGAEREGARWIFGQLRRRGRFMREVLVIGANSEGRAIADMLASNPGLGYRVLGFVDDDRPADNVSILGSTDETLDVVNKTGVTGVIIATTSLDLDTSNSLARELSDAGVHVELSSSLRDINSERLLVRPLGRFPVVYLEPVRRHGWRAAAKRTFDVVCAGTLLVLLMPLMVLVAIAIKIDSRGPILFKQRRVGKDGRMFTVLKFRTMSVDAEDRLAELRAHNEADGPLFKMRNDPRTTRLGRFLRRVSLDELPQLWNVLRNEMSMVGPRPALPSEVARWETRLRQRLRVKPGLTGMWQVNGRSNATFEAYTRLDLYYVDNWSLITDLGIILRTLPTLLRRNGAY
jgi:exopolysaccharide biosynthesis polyprenyl glycosylphosphotransferase